MPKPKITPKDLLAPSEKMVVPSDQIVKIPYHDLSYQIGVRPFTRKRNESSKSVEDNVRDYDFQFMPEKFCQTNDPFVNIQESMKKQIEKNQNTNEEE